MSLGDRMKKHEHVYRSYLPLKQYYVLRVDGKGFSNYTRNLNKPFDTDFLEDMQQTMQFLCEQIQGALFGYTQSDEISIVFTDLQSLEAQPWFMGNTQKITSVSASLATGKFNQLRCMRSTAVTKNIIANFDSRVFSLSLRDEVLNYLLWRQRDASKNSVQMLARSLFSHSQVQGLNGAQLQDKMMLEKGVNWNNLPTSQKRGSACYKELTSSKWVVDQEIPIFSKDWDWFADKI